MRFILSILLVISLFSMNSCKKDKKNKAIEVKKMLDATWAMTGTAADNNSDEILQEEEKMPKSIDEDTRVTFKNDGTASWFARNVSNSINLKATWQLGDSTSLAIYVPGYDSFYYTIDVIDNTNLYLVNDASATSKRTWTIFRKD